MSEEVSRAMEREAQHRKERNEHAKKSFIKYKQKFSVFKRTLEQIGYDPCEDPEILGVMTKGELQSIFKERGAGSVYIRCRYYSYPFEVDISKKIDTELNQGIDDFVKTAEKSGDRTSLADVEKACDLIKKVYSFENLYIHS